MYAAVRLKKWLSALEISSAGDVFRTDESDAAVTSSRRLGGTVQGRGYCPLRRIEEDDHPLNLIPMLGSERGQGDRSSESS